MAFTFMLLPSSSQRTFSTKISANGNIKLNPAPKKTKQSAKPEISINKSPKPLKPTKPPSPRPASKTCPPDAPPRREPKQISFPRPFPRSPNVAIIGGGLSGLICAIELAKRGIPSTVFDTGEHGVGGRLGTRSSIDNSLRSPDPLLVDQRLVFDHAAQYFSVSDPRFLEMVESWMAQGAVSEWDSNSIGTFNLSTASGVEYSPLVVNNVNNSNKLYIGKGGMRALAEYLASSAEASKLVEIRRPMWVNTIRYLNSASSGGGFGWKVLARGVDQGVYDSVVIAHNGKCANRLSAPMGVPAVHAALRKLKLSANWVLMVAFEGDSVPVPVNSQGTKMEGAFIKGSEVLSWAGNNTAKLRLASPDNSSLSPNNSQNHLECWTLISTQKYGKLNKVPQEAIPQDTAAKITTEMLTEFSRSLGLSCIEDLPQVVYTKPQLWGAALPINTPKVGCIWDTRGRVGVTGDWVNGGGSIEAAATSGLAMAECIYNESQGKGGKSIGLSSGENGTPVVFERVKGEDIGVFP